MKKRTTWVPVIVAALGFSSLLAPSPARAQSDYRGGSFDVRQHGYEHGYRDGYEYGLDARTRHVALDYRTDAYQDADRGYQPYFGSRDQYREGYREGYRNGAEDGYGGVRSRLEDVYGWRDRNFDPDRDRDDRNAAQYHERHWGFEDVASDIGYRDGVNAGLKDFREHHSYRPHDHDAWKDGDHGYDKSFGEKDEYKRAYRAAYEAGYRAGFGLR